MEPRQGPDVGQVLGQPVVRRASPAIAGAVGAAGATSRTSSIGRRRVVVGSVGHGRGHGTTSGGRPTVSSVAMDLLTNPEIWVALITLTVLEIVLGIDNIIFISILVQRLPAESRDRARYIGLGLAMGMRIALLLTISWIVGLTAPVFTFNGNEFSWRDLILIGGGVFLLWKATTEIGESLEGEPAHHVAANAPTAVDAERARPDRPARHRVLARLGADRGRHGRGRRWS